jgi:hypothetical protein
VRLSFYAHSLLLVLGACRPDTSRPALVPRPEAAGQEIRLPVREATQRLADALRADTIPVRRVEVRDGYMESPWFDARTGRPTNRRAVGTGVVRVRAWADPARPGNSRLTVETVYHPLLDPSLPERELEQAVPLDHRIAKKVAGVLTRMAQRYGAPPPPEPEGARPPGESDTE